MHGREGSVCNMNVLFRSSDDTEKKKPSSWKRDNHDEKVLVGLNAL